MLSVFCSPTRYTQGRGATAALGREMAALGLQGPVLFIAGNTVISRLSDTWVASLSEVAMRHAVHRFSGECSSNEIEHAKTAVRDCGAGRLSAPVGERSSIRLGPSQPIWGYRW